MIAFQSRLPRAAAALVMLVAVGTMGYRTIEGWPWFDAFYFTLYTVATIGYGEPTGMTQYGRYFTVALIIGGVGTVGYAVSLLTQAVVQGELQSALEKRRVHKAIENLEHHYIICGAGRIGARVARGLTSERVPFLVIERDAELAERLAAEGVIVLAGDATDEEVLLRAGVRRAKGLVCALPSDAENVYITLTARDLCPEIYIVTRVTDDGAVPKMRKAGADKMISTAATGAHQITQALLRPTVADFIEIATKTEGLDLVIEEVLVLAESPLAGSTLLDANIRSELNIIVISIKRASGEMIFNPTGDTRLGAGDKVIAVGTRGSIEGLTRIAAPRRATQHR